MQRQGALPDPSLARADGHEMAHPGEPVGDAGALVGNLLEDSRSSVADDVVVTLHVLPGGFAPPDPPARSLAGPHDPRSALVAHSLRSFLSGGLRPAGPPCTLARGAP